MRRCPQCAAELGPWEDDICRTCHGVDDYSIGDRTVRILETAQQPLAWWDVQRQLVRRNRYPRHVTPTSQILANDLRACWAGKGIYGLYRHGLLPGVRDLGRAAAVYIHASDAALTIDEIRFVLRHAGYRFSAGSLEPALWRVDELGIFTSVWTNQLDGSGAYMFVGSRERVSHQRAAARAMRFARREAGFHDVIERAGRQVDEAIAERRRRLRGDRANA